jgi:hypothetical protein
VLSDVGWGETSTTDTRGGAGSVTGFVLGCVVDVVVVVVVVADWLSPASPPDRLFTTGCFGFLGVIAAADVFEPDFFSVSVGLVVGFLLPPLLPVSSDFSVPAELGLLSTLALASLSPEDTDDWDAPVVADDEGDWVSDPDDDAVEESDEDEDEDPLDDEDDESDDELLEPESVGSANATPGVVAIATPTPKATAKPPTRPT